MDRSADANWMGQPETTQHRRNGHSVDSRNAADPVPLSPPPFVPPSPALTDDVPPAEIFSAQQMAELFGKAAGGAYLASIIEPVMAGLGDANTMRHYLQDLTVESNTCSDPILRMLTEMSVFGFHRVGALHASSANAKTPEAAIAYSAAATKLFAEVTKSMLALKQMQEVSMCGPTYKKVTRTQTAIEVQNKSVTKVGSNEVSNGNGKPGFPASKESETSHCRPPESPKATGNNGTGTRKAACSDLDKPALGVGIGPSHSRW